jgi:hypothetical protein
MIFKAARIPLTGAVLGALLFTAGCSTTDQDNAIIGGTTGAIIGGVTTGTLKGAAVGTAIGAGAGILIGRIADGSLFCRYQRPNGRKYIGRCP